MAVNPDYVPINYREDAEAILRGVRAAYSNSLTDDSLFDIHAVIDRITKNKQGMMTFRQQKVDEVTKELEKMTPKPRVFVELGGYVGKSALAFGYSLRKMHATDSEFLQDIGKGGSEIKVLVVEHEPQFVDIIEELVTMAGLGHIIEVVCGDSHEVLPRLKDDYHIEHIDALLLDHWQKFYVRDLKLCEKHKLLRPRSLVITDNTDFPGAPEYLKYMRDGSESGYRYDCFTAIADGPPNAANAVHFAHVTEAPK